MDEINAKLDTIISRLDALERKLDEQSDVSQKMNTHIDMVEQIYDSVKHPLKFVCDKVNAISDRKPLAN